MIQDVEDAASPTVKQLFTTPDKKEQEKIQETESDKRSHPNNVGDRKIGPMPARRAMVLKDMCILLLCVLGMKHTPETKIAISCFFRAHRIVRRRAGVQLSQIHQSEAAYPHSTEQFL